MRAVYLLALATVVACSDSDGSDPRTVTIHLPYAPSAVVAYRDGDGAWSGTSGATGTVSFATPSGTYTAVIGCDLGYERDTAVFAMTTAELSTIEFLDECGAVTQPIQGTVANAGNAYIYVGQRNTAISSSSFTVNAPTGAELVATRGVGTVDRVVVERDLSTAIAIDFNSTDAIAVQPRTVALAGMGPAQAINTGLWTAGRTYAGVCSGSGSATCVLPSTALDPDDLQLVVINQSYGASVPFRAVTWTAHDVIDRTITFAETTSQLPTVTAANQQTKVALDIDWPTAPSAPMYWFAAFQAPPQYRSWTLYESAGFLDQRVQVALPEVSNATGWNASLELDPSQPVDWYAAAASGAPLDVMVQRFPTQESTVIYNGWSGTITAQ